MPSKQHFVIKPPTSVAHKVIARHFGLDPAELERFRPDVDKLITIMESKVGKSMIALEEALDEVEDQLHIGRTPAERFRIVESFVAAEATQDQLRADPATTLDDLEDEARETGNWVPFLVALKRQPPAEPKLEPSPVAGEEHHAESAA